VSGERQWCRTKADGMLKHARTTPSAIATCRIRGIRRQFEIRYAPLSSSTATRSVKVTAYIMRGGSQVEATVWQRAVKPRHGERVAGSHTPRRCCSAPDPRSGSRRSRPRPRSRQQRRVPNTRPAPRHLLSARRKRARGSRTQLKIVIQSITWAAASGERQYSIPCDGRLKFGQGLQGKPNTPRLAARSTISVRDDCRTPARTSRL